MSESPLVSVVISTFNRCEKLQRALASVWQQTFEDFEVIVVDNASTDGTADRLAAIRDPRLRVFRHTSNQGGPAARNTGIRQSRGWAIALLDDDDEWLPGKLEEQLKLIKGSRRDLGVVYTGSLIIDDTTQAVVRHNEPSYRGRIYERLLLSTVIGSVSSAIVKRECFDRVGLFDEELRSCQDWDMWLRIARDYEFDFVTAPLTRIYQHGAQISTNYAALIPGRTRMVLKHGVEFARHPSIYVVHLKRLGKLHCINGTWSEAWPWFRRAIGVKRLEFIKIAAWCMFELPWVKWCSPARSFQKYEGHQ